MGLKHNASEFTAEFLRYCTTLVCFLTNSHCKVLMPNCLCVPTESNMLIETYILQKSYCTQCTLWFSQSSFHHWLFPSETDQFDPAQQWKSGQGEGGNPLFLSLAMPSNASNSGASIEHRLFYFPAMNWMRTNCPVQTTSKWSKSQSFSLDHLMIKKHFSIKDAWVGSSPPLPFVCLLVDKDVLPLHNCNIWWMLRP